MSCTLLNIGETYRGGVDSRILGGGEWRATIQWKVTINRLGGTVTISGAPEDRSGGGASVPTQTPLSSRSAYAL